jgi:hypothetical protein
VPTDNIEGVERLLISHGDAEAMKTQNFGA